MVVIAQLAERQNVALMVAGSSPVNHPLNREPGCLYIAQLQKYMVCANTLNS